MKKRGPNQGQNSEQIAPNPTFNQFSVKEKQEKDKNRLVKDKATK